MKATLKLLILKATVKLLIFLFIFQAQSLSGECKSSIEFRSAAFFPHSKRFREIYDQVGACYQVEACTNCCNFLNVWVNFDWFSKHGKSHSFHNPTRIQIANASFGIKLPIYSVCQFNVYTGMGGVLGRVTLKNKYCCSNVTHSKLAGGIIFKSGINYSFNSCIFVDLFADYLYQPVDYKQDRNIGGLKTGIGLGYQF